MPVDFFRPHWRHKQCGGIVAGFGDTDFRCEKCFQTGRGIGAVIPANTVNRDAYFLSHPELEVVLLSTAEVEAGLARSASA